MKGLLKRNGRFIVLLCITVICIYLISAFAFQVSIINGDSMAPTYKGGELAIINKIDKNFTYGDVVIFDCKALNRVLIKRVVACPGDSLIIKDGVLYVNGEKSDVIPKGKIIFYSGIAGETVTLSAGEYFMMGDNIDESCDSRYSEVGIINSKNIKGKIIPQK